MGDTAVLDGSEVEITELEKIEADRVDGVGSPANGIPFLLLKSLPETAAKDADGDDDGDGKCKTCGGTGTIMDGKRDCPDCDGPAKASASKAILAAVAKAVDASGAIDEGPDVDLGQQIMGLLAQAIINEAQEVKAGAYGESFDVELLTHAANMVRTWLGRESSPDDAEMDVLMCAAMKESRNFSTDERKKQADQGNALPDGSYPIPDADALKRAATLAQSGHGDVAAAKKLIARRAKELGVANPLADKDDDTSKSTVAEGETSVDTDAQGTGSQLEKAAEALAKVEALEGRMIAAEERAAKAEEQVAKFAAMPREGGPLMSVTRLNGARGDDKAAKDARYYREMADTVADPGTADHYRQLAAREEAKIAPPA